MNKEMRSSKPRNHDVFSNCKQLESDDNMIVSDDDDPRAWCHLPKHIVLFFHITRQPVYSLRDRRNTFNS